MPEMFEGLEWRCIGPHRGGRAVAVAGHPTDPMTFYFGAVAGGVWKTTDGGTYWENISDGFFTTAAVGAIAVAPSDPTVIYVGTGETSIRGNVSHGDGVYRSTDGGSTWRNMGLPETRHISRIRVHPHDPHLVYVAALGHAWGPNEERGVYRSRDGGETWEQVLFRSDRAGAIDLSLDPNNPRILYAALWEAQRYPHGLNSGGPGSSIYRSTDGGDTWVDLTDNPGLPKGVKGKIGVAVSPAKPGRVWALVEAKDGALFRSDDGGETWERLSEDNNLRYRAWYYMHLYADPQDADTCWVLNFGCWRSIDGGTTFAQIPTPHGDNQDLWIDPQNPLRMIEGNDGGACVSFNGGMSWSSILNQPTAQLYHVSTDDRVPFRVYGSQQDNSAISVPVWSTSGAISYPDWIVPGGGESGYLAVRPDDPDIVYGGAIGSGDGDGRLIRYNHRTGEWRNITVWPDNQGWADGANTLKYRFQWTFPVVISPHDPQVLYVGANQVLRSTDDGFSWEEISPDLTRNDPSKLESSGGPITKDNTGAEIYCTIFALVESPHAVGEFWAGTDDGLVHLSRDGGATWREITPPDLPEWALISTVELSPHAPGTAYLAATRYKLDDTRPFLYKTSDYGATWTAITDGIPETEFTRAIREDPGRRGLLFAGTETQVYISFDDGASWTPFRTNLPVVPVHDLVVKRDTLVAATHGRSFWVLDDISPLRALEGGKLPNGMHLFTPPETPRLIIGSGWGSKGVPDAVRYDNAGPVTYGFRQRTAPDGSVTVTPLDAGANPPYGGLLTYYLPETPAGEVSLTITDGEGREVRRYSSKPDAPAPVERDDAGAEGDEGSPTEPARDEPVLTKRAGLNRFAWDLRHAGATKIPDDKSIEAFPAGPLVVPGAYTATLRAGDTSVTAPVTVVQDPRTEASLEDLQAQADLGLRIRDKLTETHEAVIRIRDLSAQIAAWTRRLDESDATAEARQLARIATVRLRDVERALIEPRNDSALRYPSKLNSRLAALPGFAEGSDNRPTEGMKAVFDLLSGLIDHQLERLRTVEEGDVAAFNTAVRELGLDAVGVKE